MTAALKPYPAVKDSAAPWLGEVPEHWEVLPALAAYRPRFVKNTGMIETTVLSLSYGRIIIKSPEKLRGLVPESFETYQVVDPGSIIVRTTDLQNDQTSLRVGHSKHRGIITSAYMCLETTPRISNEFGYQYLNAYDMLKIIYGFGSGLRQNLDFSDIKRMPVVAPPLAEQHAIVRFLHHADRLIGRYIRAKQKLLKLLEEQKQAIIHRAVTRGLDPDARLKPSGVEWLGDVPEHWEVVLNQRLFKEEVRSHRGQRETQLSLSQRNGLIPTDQLLERSLQTSSFDNWKVTLPGDLVLNRFKAHLGVFFASTLRGIVSFHYGVFVPRRPLESKYFELLYHTNVYRAIYAGRSNGMTVGLQNLSNQNFYNVRSIVPPFEEQRAIIAFCDTATEQLQGTIRSTAIEVDLLREYRTRLNADVVTGKLDVREAAAQLPEDVEGLVDEDELDEEIDDEDEANVDDGVVEEDQE